MRTTSPSSPGPVRTRHTPHRQSGLRGVSHGADLREAPTQLARAHLRRSSSISAGDEDALSQDPPIPLATNGRLKAKGFFLTYSQVGEHPISLVEDQVVQKYMAKIKNWAAMEEVHQDGGKHWHVFLLFHAPLQTRDHKAFDINADWRTILHPNIRISRCSKEDLKRLWAYINKTGAPSWEHGSGWTLQGQSAFRIYMPPLLIIFVRSKTKLKEVYANALLSDSRETYLNTIRDGDPRTFVIYNDKIMAYADRAFPTPVEEYTPPFTNFNRLPQEVVDWVTEEFPKTDRPKTLILWGPSRTAKTSWARSLGSHCYMNIW
ncbi:hypothetical protein EI94DRAFT_1893735 [Lactarius quietus]|nr:hypothetical protein EI94DRAFT_1893735 [Lactarius quietus]